MGATLKSLTLFLPLLALGAADVAHAQFTGQPTAQTVAPAATSTPTEPAARPTGASPRRSAKAQAARKARAEARQEARKRRSGSADAATSARAAAETSAQSPVILLGGEAQTTDARSAEDIAALLSAVGLDVRARPGRMSLSDIAASGEADLVIVQSDALEDARREDNGALTRKFAYIARLYNQEVHVLARAGIVSFADLEGRSIAASAPETPEGRATQALFDRAGLTPRLIPMSHTAALQRLGRGEIDAAVLIGGKPSPALVDLHIAGLQLIPIPYKGALQDHYYPARITADDYPHLVPKDGEIETIATGTLLLAVDAKPNQPRFQKIGRAHV